MDVIVTNMFEHYDNFYFLTLLFTSLHVSASTGHPQVKYTQLFLEAIMPTVDLFWAIKSIISYHVM
jgi:hypothetical protein